MNYHISKLLRVDLKSKVRDTQRSRLYKAEEAAKLDQWSQGLPRLTDIESFTRRKFPNAPLESRYGIAADLHSALDNGLFEIKDGRGRSSAGGCAYSITMPKWSRTEWIVVHEFAHAIHQRLPYYHDLFGGAGHGWQYAIIYLDLVRYLLGEAAYSALKSEFKVHKVKFRRSKKR